MKLSSSSRSLSSIALALLVQLIVVCLPLHSRAELSATAFDSANKLYEQGKFSDAAAAYEKLLHSGQASTALYFNLGNAYFKAGQIGRAIAAYDQAEQFTPRDPDLRANLQFARNQIQGPTLAPTRWQKWLARLSLNEWTWLTAAAFWVWLLLLTIGQWRPALKPALRTYVFSSGIAVALLCACFATVFQQRSAKAAIVITREAVVRQAPIEEANLAFTVHDGAELEILDQKEDWLQVTTDARRIGWVRREQVLVAPRT